VEIKAPKWHVDLTVNANDNSFLDDCVPVFVNYSTHIEFDLAMSTDKDSTTILVPGTQNVNIQTGNCPDFTVISVNAPSAITFAIFCTIENRNVNLWIVSASNDFATFVLRYVDPDDGEISNFDGNLDILSANVEFWAPFSFPIDQPSYTSSGTALVWGAVAGAIGPYTLTVTKVLK
jgi:hypothetical protein